MADKKVIVTIAPTGGVATKAQTPHVPTQPQEIADCTVRCHKEGAAIVAIHARRPDDEATCNADIYRHINGLIRDRCDIILNNSTGGGTDGDCAAPRPDGRYEVIFEERLKGCDGGAEMATFDGMNLIAPFQGREVVFLTSPSQCDTLAERLRSNGVKPEWEVMSPTHILQDVNRLIAKGLDKPPYYINIVLGTSFQGALPYSYDLLDQMIDLLPPQSIFCVSGVGAAQIPATTQAILRGGHVRVGIEDNLYYSRGVLGKNEDMVARTVRIIKELGYEPASPAEARDMIGLAQL